MFEWLLGNVGFGIKMLFYKEETDGALKEKLLQLADKANLPQEVYKTINQAYTHDQLLSALELVKHLVLGGI